MSYNKPPTTYQQQIEILKARGLFIPNEEAAIGFLKNVHYYRLSAYFLPFQYPKDSEKRDCFKEQVSFEDIQKLYLFDVELKNFFLLFLGKIECSLRAKISYVHSHQYTAVGYLNPHNFKNRKSKNKNYTTLFDEIMSKINGEQSRANEAFIQHIKTKYETDKLPLWALVEIMSFGTLSKIFKILHTQEKNLILEEYGLLIDTSVLENWIEQLVILRNIIAHCGRFWNRSLCKEFIYPKKPVGFLQPEIERNKVFFALSVLAKILKDPSIKLEFQALLAKYPNIPTKSMGIPQNWESLSPWSN